MINQAALDLIKRSEGWVDHAYVDPGTGGEPLTIGFGHTSAAGPPRVTAGMVISKEQGEAILIADLADTELTVKHLVKRPLNANQYGACVSFCFNLGGSNFASSTLLRLINEGKFDQASLEFQKWNHAAGRVLPGLTIRREAERALFMTPSNAPPAGTPIQQAPSPMPTPRQPPTTLFQTLAGILRAIIAMFGRKAPK